MTYYFAYGSNMNHKQMKRRCPTSKFIKRVYLEGYCFVYDGHSKSRNGAVANVIKSNTAKVWGGLFEINEDNLAALDCYEGHPKTYKREEIVIKDENGKSITAYIYRREEEKTDRPGEEYRRTVKQGAQDCGLPNEYIKAL